MKLFLALMLWAGGTFAAPFPAVPSGPILLSAQVKHAPSAIAPLSVFFDLTNSQDSLVPTNGVGVPFHDMQCTWDFGDPSSGNWNYGANVADGTPLASRNRAIGLVAAHVYETAGTYTASVSCTDGTNTKNYSMAPVTVVSADTAPAFAGNNTKCFAANTLPVAGVDGCPAGALVYNLTAEYGSADFDQALANHATSSRRLLFKHDDSFELSTAVSVLGTTGYVGMYGTGAKPDILFTGSLVNVLGTAISLGNSLGLASDWRWVDLRIGGSGVTSRTSIFGSGGHANHLLFLRLDTHDLGNALSLAHNSLDALNDVVTGTITTLGAVVAGDTVLQVNSTTGLAVGQAVAVQSTNGGNDFSVKNIPDYRGIFITAVDDTSSPKTVTLSAPLGQSGPSVGTTMTVLAWTVPHNPTYPIYDHIFVVDTKVERIVSGIGLYPTGSRVAILGNYLNDSDYSGSEFLMRVPYMGKGVIGNNTFSNAKANKSALTLRAPPYPGTPTYGLRVMTEYVMVTGNKFVAGLEATTVTVMPKNEQSDERHRYVHVVGNLFIAGVNTTILMQVDNADTDVVRNNVFDMSLAVGGTAISISGNTGHASPQGYRALVYNNTIVKRSTSPTCDGVAVKCGGFVAVSVASGASAVQVANNLVYAPLATSTPPDWFPVTVVRNLTTGGVTGAPGTHGNTSDVQLINTNPNFLNASGVWSQASDYKPNCTGSTYPCAQGIALPVWGDFLLSPTTSRDIGALTH